MTMSKLQKCILNHLSDLCMCGKMNTIYSRSIWPDNLAFRICLGNLSSGSRNTRRAIKEPSSIFIKPSFELAASVHIAHFGGTK